MGLGTALDLSGSPFQAAKAKGESKIVHSACPRNCYDTCSILSTVEDGVLKRVEGDKANTYTRGRLCAKGFSYTRSVYSPDRIKYPMRQSKRGGGRWERISWPDAFIEQGTTQQLQDRYGFKKDELIERIVALFENQA